MVLRGMVNVVVALCMMNAVDAAIARDMEIFGRTLLCLIGVTALEFAIGMFSRFALQSYCKCNLVQAKVLFGLNLSFERGKRYVVLGESGTGKSTLAKVLY